MSPTNFVTMCLTSRAAVRLRQAVRYSHELGVSPFNQMAKGDLGYALSLHRQHGGGDLYLSNDPAMRNMVSSVVWTAANTGPVELRSSFRTLQSVFEKFGTVMGGDDAEKMTQRLEAETAKWRERGSKRSELPALYSEVYKPFARMIRENADVMMRDGMDRWVEVLVGNVDVIDAFKQNKDLKGRYGDVIEGMYMVLGAQRLYKSLVIICGDIFSFDYEGLTRDLKAEGRDNAVDMITADYSFSGLCMMSEHGEDVILKLGRAADYVRRKNSLAVDYLRRMEGEFDSNPVAERSRLILLWYAIRNVDVLFDELDEILHDVCQRMADLDNQLLAKATAKESLPALYVTK